MKIKKILCSLTAVALCGLPLTACNGGNGGGNASTVKVYMPDGAPAIAMSKLMSDGYDGAEFTVVNASSIAQRVSSGDADIAVMPINGAAALYNKGAKITMLSVNTHGNLYIVGANDESVELDDLVGKKVGVIGQGNVPDLTFRMLLKESEISYSVSDTTVDGGVAIKYGADGTALFPLLNRGEIDYVVAAEPAVNSAVTNMNKHIVADMQELWSNTVGGDYPQACVVAKTELVNGNPTFITNFMNALEASDGWVEDHSSEAISAIKSHMEEGVTSTLADNLPKAVIERCNVKTVSATNAKMSCTAYFSRLTTLNADGLGTTVLNKVPDDGFYLTSSVWTNSEN